MSRDHGAIVEQSVDLAQLRRQWDAVDAREQRTLAETRLEKGRILVEARKAFPRTGNDGGWAKLLFEWSIEPRTALNYMGLAGYVAASEKLSEANPTTKPPTYAEAGIAKPTPRQPDPPAPRAYQGIAFPVAPAAPVLPFAAAPAPSPQPRPARVWTDEDREAEQRYHVTRIQPPKMETREDRTRRLSLAWNDAAAAIQRIRDEAKIHLTDATTSPDDFESVKKTIVSVARAALDELEAAGALDAPEPRRRQLSILDGGKP